MSNRRTYRDNREEFDKVKSKDNKLPVYEVKSYDIQTIGVTLIDDTWVDRGYTFVSVTEEDLF